MLKLHSFSNMPNMVRKKTLILTYQILQYEKNYLYRWNSVVFYNFSLF